MANALNKVNSGGIEDGSIVNADIKSDAAIAGSKLAAATTSAAGSMSAADKTKLDGVATSATANPSAPALTGSTDNTICTVTGANAIQGEANLTFDGSTLEVTGNVALSNSTQSKILLDTSDASDNKWLSINGGGDASQTRGGGITFFGNEVTDNQGRINIAAGNSGNTNGSINFNTAGSERLRVQTDGNVVIGDGTTSTTFLDVRRADNTVYSATSNHVNGIKVFNDSNVDGGFAGIELAATDAQDYYGSTVLKSIADGENYSNDFVIQTRHSTNYAERLRITSEGYVTKPNQPSFCVSINTDTDRGTNGKRVLPFDTEFHDNGGNWNTSTYRFTAPVAGKYFFILSVNHIGDTIYYISKNGSDVHKGEFRSNTDGTWEHAAISGMIVLAASDYVEAKGNLNTSTTGTYLWNAGSSTSSSWDSFTGWLVH